MTSRMPMSEHVSVVAPSFTEELHHSVDFARFRERDRTACERPSAMARVIHWFSRSGILGVAGRKAHSTLRLEPSRECFGHCSSLRTP